MATGVISLERMDANMMRRLRRADQECVVSGYQRIPLTRVVATDQIGYRMAYCGNNVGTLIITNDVPSVRVGIVHRTFSRPQSTQISWGHL